MVDGGSEAVLSGDVATRGAGGLMEALDVSTLRRNAEARERVSPGFFVARPKAIVTRCTATAKYLSIQSSELRVGAKVELRQGHARSNV